MSILYGIIFVKTPICNNFNVSRSIILLFFVTRWFTTHYIIILFSLTEYLFIL
nr:MAG TPA: hypothetical protein [Caudoviricetes sp.]